MPFLLLALVVLACRVWPGQHKFLRKPGTHIGCNTARLSTDYTIENTSFQRKPLRVLREVIRLKALMPADTGCRVIAEQFNRLHGGKKDGETVGRTWVSKHLKKHRYAVLQLRRRLKHTKPRPLPAHKIWAMDMTGVPDHAQESQTVLGIIGHGSRWLLGLRTLHAKTSIALLRALLDAIEAHDFQKPECLRTDNEAVFTSRLFRFGLWWLGIRHQRTEMGCPWQNGRIERLFGTLKEKSAALLFDANALPDQLSLFRFWYNRVRTHQYLDGRTPLEVLSRLPAQYATDNKREPEWFEAWNGGLAGYWFPLG